MTTRKQLLLQVAKLAGDAMQVEDPGSGWPGVATISLPRGPVRAAVHVGPIGLSHRERDDVERRFQNPGKDRPMLQPIGTNALLIGLWEEGGKIVLVAFDAARRVGRTTRFSLFIPLWLLEKAALTGWAEHVSTSDEPVVAFHPALLPIYVEMLLQGAQVTAESIASVLDASGLVDTTAQPAEERARRAAMTLVRSATFGKNVVEAYEGLCAMCGLNLGLCQGAHIYPASAPQSPDEVWNGIALCSNHHVAFDRHLVWVEPGSRAVRVHPEVSEHAKDNKPSRIFLESTVSELREPNASVVRPRDEMFTQRYDFYEEKYEWAS